MDYVEGRSPAVASTANPEESPVDYANQQQLLYDPARDKDPTRDIAAAANSPFSVSTTDAHQEIINADVAHTNKCIWYFFILFDSIL